MKQFKTIMFLSIFILYGGVEAKNREENPDENPLYLLSNKAVSIGIGSQREYDTYLSPLLYKGTGLTLMSEQLKHFSRRSNKFSWYSEPTFRIGLVENPAKNATMIPFSLRYFLGMYYHIRPVQNMNILVGPMWNMDLGGRSLLSNQNNPASFIWNTNIWASAMAYYHVPLRRRTLTFREHFALPLADVMFSPDYMQSYYDILEVGSSDNIIVFTSPVERLEWRNKISMDLPTRFCTFRFGFLAERTVTHVNKLETRSTNLSFLIGWVYNFTTFKNRNPIPKEFGNPTE